LEPGSTTTHCVNSVMPNSSGIVGITSDHAAVLVLGSSDESWNGIPLPWSLAGLGAPNCSLLASADVTLAMTTGPLGTSAWSLNVPTIPELFGITLFTQWAVIDPGANALGLVFSDGGAATLGDQ